MKYIDRNGRCTACQRRGVDLHHVKTRKSGGNDDSDNLMPLCRKHHQEVHQIGMGKMSVKYPSVKHWLIENKRYDILERIGEWS